MAGGTFTWETWKRMFNSRVFALPLLHGDNMYIIGGCDQMGKPITAFEMYETKKRKWHNLPEMPTARASPAAAILGDKIIVIGGVGEGQNPVNAVEMYNIKAKKWEKMEPLSEALLGLSSVVRGKINMEIPIAKMVASYIANSPILELVESHDSLYV